MEVTAQILVKGFNPVIISGSTEWAGSSAWYADETGQAEERPVCKPSKWSRDRKVAGSNPARSTNFWVHSAEQEIYPSEILIGKH
jgi:hypothetical protein